MGKRSDFARNERDYYPTPAAAVAPLLPFLPPVFTYAEPCAGDGALIRALPGDCVWASDIEPQMDCPAMDWRAAPSFWNAPDFIITNPPWRRDVLHPFIEEMSRHAPTWLLIDADWMHTVQAAPYLDICTTIVSIGRVKWVEGSKHTGKDNCCWFCFDRERSGLIRFYGRAA